MVLEALLLPAAGAAAFAGLKIHKSRHYRGLQSSHARIMRDHAASLALPTALPETLPDFSRHLATLPAALPDPTFTCLRDAALRFVETERNYILGHKQGGTIAYETLHEMAPEIVAFYQSDYLRRLCSAVIGARVEPTPVHDQSSCSLLVYNRPRDHIGWHYDYDFYQGRHFTVLLALVNQRKAEPQALSSARLFARLDGAEVEIPTPPNTLIMFEGNRVLHKVTRLDEGELRVMLSMTFCTDSRASLPKAIARRVKDTAFFGVRALWT